MPKLKSINWKMFYIVHFESTLGPDVGLSKYYLHNDGKECWYMKRSRQLRLYFL